MTTNKVRVSGHVAQVTSTWTVADTSKTTKGIVQPAPSKPQSVPAASTKKEGSA